MTPTSTLERVPTPQVATLAVRALAEGRVRITEAGGDYVYALVQGSRVRPYLVTYGHRDHPQGQVAWMCDCLAATYGQTCHHIVAVDRVWQPEPRYVTAPALALVRS
jgi:uncharacterized Zn finger protein